MPTVPVMLVAFWCGAIPVGYLVSRRAGVDPRRVGSGNVGAANVARAAGLWRGVLTLVLDGLKGAGPVMLGGAWGGGVRLAAGAGCAAILGHVFSPFLGFRGGKGVATTAGAFLALSPPETLVAVGLFGAVFAVGRVVSAASLAGVAALPMLCAASGRPVEVIGLSTAVAALVIVRHSGNLRRLARGKELGLNSLPPTKGLGAGVPEKGRIGGSRPHLRGP